MADGFLGRWSRRKQDVLAGKPVEDPPVPAPAPAARTASVAPPPAAAQPAPPDDGQAQPAQQPPLPTLSDAQALTPQSDFKPFVARGVSPEVRNLAMKKLFADPHFNVMDGLDIYIGDYTQPDPLPDGMLRKMASAHFLGFFKAEDEAAAQAAADAAAASASVSEPAGAREDAGVQGSPPVAQSDSNSPSNRSSQPAPPDALPDASPAVPASQQDYAHADLRLQPDDAPRRPGVGRGTS